MTQTHRKPRLAPAAARVFAMVVSLAAAAHLTGCSSLPSGTGLPRGATLVAETPDFKSGFTAPDDGTIYIFHRGEKSYLRYSGPIKQGAIFTIDPESNAATIEGKPLEVTVPGGGHYQVYFRPASAEPLSGI